MKDFSPMQLLSRRISKPSINYHEARFEGSFNNTTELFGGIDNEGSKTWRY
jgi:hypothetical protein